MKFILVFWIKLNFPRYLPPSSTYFILEMWLLNKIILGFLILIEQSNKKKDMYWMMKDKDNVLYTTGKPVISALSEFSC